MVRNPLSRIAWRTAGATVGLLSRANRSLNSNPAFYKAIYSLHNSHEFSNIFEHEKMLADPVRVNTYAEAIQRAVKPGDVVVDLGTGSGILAILAARQGAKVYAIDHSDFIHLAEENARRNGIENIRFIRTNSKNFAPAEKIDVLLHEQIGDDLFNENMVENLLEMKGRLLKPEGKILPGRFHLYLEPVAMVPEFRVPFIDEINIQGFDFRHLGAAGHSYRAKDYKYHWVERQGVDFFLSEPEPVLTVDLNEMDEPSGIPATIDVTRTVLRAGNLDGIQQYFGIDFDEQVAFDTSPFSPRTCWSNRIFRVPWRRCEVGDSISYRIDLSDLLRSETWSVELLPSAVRPAAAPHTSRPPRPERSEG